MPQLLLEFLTEEIPARMQARAAADLKRAIAERLIEAGFTPEGVETFAGPRRLSAVVEGLAQRSADVREERKGPRTDAPQPAIDGFLRGAGLASLDSCETREDKKGAFYVAVIERPGRAARDVIAEIVPDIARNFAWPKSMKLASSFRWVRPLRRILCVYDGEVVPFVIDGVAAGDLTEGHRVMGRGPFKVRDFEDYAKTLKSKGFVVLDAAQRREIIAADAKTLCEAQGLELVEDEGLLQEVTGLAEWPVVLVGDMDPAFLDLPPEVIRLTMRTHQKYFAVRDPKTGKLAPKFVTVANQVAPDGGAAIAAGNARVLSARLNDARHFWALDQKTPLAEMAGKLSDIVFHQKLGSVADKVERVAALARELAPKVGADPDLAERAARLSKADLVSGMVGEFPELQGVMGRYYALIEAGLDPLEPARFDAVADAIRDHYKPQGPSDAVPSEPVAVAVALADKLDTLVGFWAIDEKPTGSGDPYALRRAALGVIRIVLGGAAESVRHPGQEQRAPGSTVDPGSAAAAPGRDDVREVRLRLRGVIEEALIYMLGVFESRGYWIQKWSGSGSFPDEIRILSHEIFDSARCVDWITVNRAEIRIFSLDENLFQIRDPNYLLADLLAFFADRLKVHLREQGLRHDLVDAVFAPNPVTGHVEDDLVLIVKRVEALDAFIKTEDGAELLAGYKRAANILAAEQKKGFDASAAKAELAGADASFAAVMAALSPGLQAAEEKALHAALTNAGTIAAEAVAREDFTAAMAAIAPLRPAVDAFFERVIVNAEEPMLRRNRLLLLSQIRDALSAVADASKIGG